MSTGGMETLHYVSYCMIRHGYTDIMNIHNHNLTETSNCAAPELFKMECYQLARPLYFKVHELCSKR